MRKSPNEKFVRELQEVKAQLPTHYYTVLNFLYPGKYPKSQVYNVVNAGVENWDILKALKRVAQKNKQEV